MKKEKPQNNIRNQIIAVCIAVIVISIALLLFIDTNTERIVAQNGEYLVTSTGQTARRLNDLCESSLRSTETAAKIYEESYISSDIDPKEVATIFDFSQFDQAFFIEPDGTAYNSDGRTAIATDRNYYILGMQGESGMCEINNPIFEDQKIIAFFAPIYNENEIVGVLVCSYKEDTFKDFMTTKFLDAPTPTYLCEREGSIIAQSTDDDKNIDSVDEIFSNDNLIDITLDEINTDIASGIDSRFTFKSVDGIGNAYIMKLPDFDLMIIRLFPASITNSMLNKANISGIILVGGLIAAALIVIIVFMLQARRQQRQLLLERQKATRIIDASTNLFNNLLLIDFEDNTYEFLKKDYRVKDLASYGSYEKLCNYFKVIEGKIDNPEDTPATLVFLSRDAINKALPEGVSYIQQEWRSQSSKGYIWYQVSTLCLDRDSDGKPLNVLVTVQDVTDVKSQEIAARKALEDAFTAAEHASQAKSDFLNSMSHDIRTPMNSIMGLTAIASMHINDTERVRDCLNNISSASKHLLGLINEVLDMAKIESGTIGLSEEPFNLPETVGNLVSIVHPQISAKNQNLKVDMTNIKHEYVIGDPTRLQQVFVNIVGNSIKFTPDGGDILISVKELPSRIPECGCYEFVFSDTGCGMSDEFLKTVFEPFTRANDSRTTKIEGTGLGMAIVKSVVSLMNGSVEVTSKEGEGTTFTVVVHLKLRDGASENVQDLQGIRVLVVDDDEVACQGASILLDKIGMRPEYRLSGKDGIDAVVAADKTDDPYKAVILDWRMPEMSGIETARAIREVTPNHMPIIILSGYDWSMIEQEAKEIGIDAFIAKPLYRSRLVQVMKELLTGASDPSLDDKTMLEGLTFSDKRILLTEDNAMAALIAEEIIGMTGAQIEHAENGALAVEMIQQHEPNYYDLVLMDIQMPVMNGYESTEAIRKLASERPDLAEIPIVALSADAFAEDVKRAIASGMNDHMAKPIEIEPLTRMLKKWMS